MGFSDRISGNWDSDAIQSVAFKDGYNPNGIGDIFDTNFIKSNLNVPSKLFSKNTQSLNNNLPNKMSGKLQQGGGYFSSANLGGTLQGIGAVAGALASIYGMQQQKKFNKEILNMEKQRVAKENRIADERQSNYDKVWKKTEENI